MGCKKPVDTGRFLGEGYLVDPPSGWRYGFPVKYDFKPSSLEWDIFRLEREKWFLDKGYPKELIDQGMLNHLRFMPIQ